MTRTNVATRRGNLITPEVLIEQIRAAIEENPQGVGHDAWTRHTGIENRERAKGMLIVAFRLLRILRMKREQVEELNKGLLTLIEKIGDSEVYEIFYRGMANVLLPRRVKLPERRFELMEPGWWRQPL
jgi:hypothetical protein